MTQIDTDNQPPKSKLQLMVEQVTTNPAKLPFPVDRWGFTSAIKKEILKAASTIQGNEVKHELLLNTLVVLITHVKLRQLRDKEHLQKRFKFQQEQAKERGPRERVTGSAPKSATSTIAD